jgi:hypothetical protein
LWENVATSTHYGIDVLTGTFAFSAPTTADFSFYSGNFRTLNVNTSTFQVAFEGTERLRSNLTWLAAKVSSVTFGESVNVATPASPSGNNYMTFAPGGSTLSPSRPAIEVGASTLDINVNAVSAASFRFFANPLGNEARLEYTTSGGPSALGIYFSTGEPTFAHNGGGLCLTAVSGIYVPLSAGVANSSWKQLSI